MIRVLLSKISANNMKDHAFRIAKTGLVLASLVTSLFSYTPAAVAAVSGSASFNSASSWQFTSAYGVANPVSNQKGGWVFDFPVYNRPISDCYADLTCPYVGYLMTYPGAAIPAGGYMTMTAQITTTGNPVFNYQTEPFNTCTTPPHARFIIQDIFDNGTYEYARWWSEAVAFELKPGGALTISAPFDPAKWISVLGKPGNYNAAATAAFYQVLKTPGALGLTFGGGCFYGHGINITGGTAQFHVSDFSIKGAGSPLYFTASVANSASSTSKLTGNGWASVYGQDLITDSSCPLPTTLVTQLCGTSVKVNGQAALLNYAGKTQVNFLLPDVYGPATVEVTNKDGSGPLTAINPVAETMDLFSQSSDGKGTVSAQHWTTPGVPLGTLVSTQIPARETYPLVIYAAGLGAYGNMTNKPTLLINSRPVSSTYINYVGPNSSVGQYQVNLDRMSFTELGITQTGTYSIQLCGGSVCGNKLDLPVVVTPPSISQTIKETRSAPTRRSR